MNKPILYNYFRSSCSWRVRLALHLKDVDFEYRSVHLYNDGGEHNQPGFKALNPMGQVPAFVVDGVSIAQSVAILEFLEEKYPEKTHLLPKDAINRAKVREIVEVINSGIQPLQNLAVMDKATDDPEKKTEWGHHWIEIGLRAVEKLVSKSGGKFCVGDSITLADCCVVPQMYNARNRFGVDMSQFPVLCSIEKNLESLPAFKAAHPAAQPDCPQELRGMR